MIALFTVQRPPRAKIGAADAGPEASENGGQARTRRPTRDPKATLSWARQIRAAGPDNAGRAP
jgi:hypothetical protein